jgi:hypothetical protein
VRERLTYFMWGFQQHCRSDVEYSTERVLEPIGVPVRVRLS